jgi:hypothetical protein
MIRDDNNQDKNPAQPAENAVGGGPGCVKAPAPTESREERRDRLEERFWLTMLLSSLLLLTVMIVISMLKSCEKETCLTQSRGSIDSPSMGSEYLHFIVASDAHFGGDVACPKYDRTGYYLRRLSDALGGREYEDVAFVVFNGDLVEYEDAYGYMNPSWQACMRDARRLLMRRLPPRLRGSTLFTIGNNDILSTYSTAGPCMVKASIDSFACAFLPTIPGANPNRDYYWQDPIPGLRDQEVAMFGFFLPDAWLIDQRLCPPDADLKNVMAHQLSDFEEWVDRIVSEGKVKLALVFVHHGPITNRTDGLPYDYTNPGSGMTLARMRSHIDERTYYYDDVLTRLARALQKLDKNSNRVSSAHAVVITGHYHLGRVVSHLEGVDVLLDGALVKNRAVTDSGLHTFLDIKWEKLADTARPYDSQLQATFMGIPADSTAAVTEVMRTHLYLRRPS